MYMNSTKRITLGIYAHVDSGKTTLSEALLYKCGAIRQLGRVDHRDSYLDSDAMERTRGITIYSKQAELGIGGTEAVLLDTPGHVDFSAEMERTLSVLDYAVLIVDGKEGVQGHTLTLWRLLEKRGVPVFIWVNKMDMDGADRETVIEDIKKNLSENACPLDDAEGIAMCDGELLDEYLETETVSETSIRRAVSERKYYPILLGSALKLDGVDELIRALDVLTEAPCYGDELAARVFKITRDARGERLTHLKITGGRLAVRESIEGCQGKVSQIRIYSGEKFRTADAAEAGMVCQVTGLEGTYAGQGLGAETSSHESELEAVLTYGIITPEGVNVHEFMSELRQLEEEVPELRVEWSEQAAQAEIRLMGDVQLEIIKDLIASRTGVQCDFTEGSIAYKETITEGVYGYGHFEPLRHYAEVKLYLEPLPEGSGIEIATISDEDDFDRGYQSAVLSALASARHIGPLGGYPVTDIRIILVAGKAHLKHTEGGDLRQASLRAVRQALRTAAGRGRAVLLEPWCEYRMSMPAEHLGRAMADIRRMSGVSSPPETGQDGISVLTGRAPVSEIRGYGRELATYTRGYGRLSLRQAGYSPCHNEEAVIDSAAYDADRDLENTADSIFCYHGAGVNINWKDVPEYAHLGTEDVFARRTESEDGAAGLQVRAACRGGGSGASEEELKRIFEMTYGPERVRQPKDSFVRPTTREVTPTKPQPVIPEYLLVDGYNIIFAWEELRELGRENIDSAREALIDLLCEYRSQASSEIIVVFDAYRVKGGTRRMEERSNIHVIYTGEAESADTFIERATYETSRRKYRVRVATSDVAEQIIVLSNNAEVVKPDQLKREVEAAKDSMRKWLEDYKLKLRLRTRNTMDIGGDH